MPGHVIIDGNNLLYAMHACAPMPPVGRETLVRIVERWAGPGDDEVTLVFDGPIPPPGLAGQMSSDRITVRFSAPVTADDIIVDMIYQAGEGKDDLCPPTAIRVVTSDNAIRHEAKGHRSQNTTAADFIDELLPHGFEPRPPGSVSQPTSPPTAAEKPGGLSAKEAKGWRTEFGLDDEPEPFDGYDAMRP